MMVMINLKLNTTHVYNPTFQLALMITMCDMQFEVACGTWWSSARSSTTLHDFIFIDLKQILPKPIRMQCACLREHNAKQPM